MAFDHEFYLVTHHHVPGHESVRSEGPRLPFKWGSDRQPETHTREYGIYIWSFTEDLFLDGDLASRTARLRHCNNHHSFVPCDRVDEFRSLILDHYDMDEVAVHDHELIGMDQRERSIVGHIDVR